jgi:hypothetical protein
MKRGVLKKSGGRGKGRGIIYCPFLITNFYSDARVRVK